MVAMLFHHRSRSVQTAPTREQILTLFLACGLQVIVDGLAGLIRQLELGGVARLLLPYRCTVHRVAVWRNIVDLDGYDFAAAKRAIDGEVKQGEVTYSSLSHDCRQGPLT